MKTRRSIYIVVGTVLILLNILLDIVNPDSANNFTGDAFNIGYFLGSHFLVISGLVLLSLAYKVDKKIKMKKLAQLEREIDEIGK